MDLDYFNSLLQKVGSLEKEYKFPDAFNLLREGVQKNGNIKPPPRTIAALEYAAWKLNPVWWANISHDDITLRRTRTGDSDFFKSCFEDESFRVRFNRQRPWTGDLGKALEKFGQQAPVNLGMVMWVVESRLRGSLGIASLSSLDSTNMKTELSVGFPGDVLPTIGIKTTLMMLHFAFMLVGLNKVYSYIYEDNQAALNNALHLGFLHEGTLSDHFRINGNHYHTVHAIGLTRKQALTNQNLCRLVQRKIGQTWR